MFVGLSAGKYNNPRRKIMLSTWSDPVGPEIYGLFKTKYDNAEQYLNQIYNATGKRVSYIPLIFKAIAEMMKDLPDVNGRVAFGNYVPNKSIDISFFVHIPEKKISHPVCIKAVDTKSIVQIHDELEKEVQQVKSRKDNLFLNYIPTCFRGVFSEVRVWLGVSLGLEVPFLGISSNSTGCSIVADVSASNLDTVYLPFIPALRTPTLFVVNGIRDEPWIVDGEPVVKKTISITATLDHRYLDGTRAAKGQNKVKDFLENPEKYMGSIN